jgi:hypothetical protein
MRKGNDNGANETPIRTVPAQNINTVNTGNVHLALVEIIGAGLKPQLLEVATANLAVQPFDLIIGRDLLSLCQLNYDGKNAVYTIS